jgi:predicted ABC-class ATPase
MERLRRFLRSVDGGSYKALKGLTGSYAFPEFRLEVDHVQGDPFAAPSRMSLFVPMAEAGFPRELWNTPTRRTACEDYIGRAVARATGRHVRGGRGSGHSGEMGITTNGQQVLVRNAVLLHEMEVEARITMGLPARGRRVAGRDAEAMFFDELPRVVADALFFQRLPADEVAVHVNTVDDQESLRAWLVDEGLTSFVADGAVLPRRSGIDDRPLAEEAVPFQAPESLARTVELPHAGPVRGMALPQGVTLIVGGGFHGKSTLLHALERGVYNHIPGDGREGVVTDPTAMKVRAEDGRAVNRVDISAFIDHLPLARDTHAFTTENASGSTSQAANIVEALESGCRLLLVDEDTSATNFMIRDERMQRLVAREKEPITPFLHRVRELYERHGISTILVMGGSGDYFEVADTVVMMDNYTPRDATGQARALAGDALHRAGPGALPPIEVHAERRPGPRTLDASLGKREAKISAKGANWLQYGRHTVDLTKVEQLIDAGQTEAIGWIIRYYAARVAEGESSLIEGLRQALAEIEHRGLDIVTPWKVGNLALPRLQELAAAVNRIRDGDWR